MRPHSSVEHSVSIITLAVVRVMTACLVAVVGSYLIDDVEGALGAKNEMSLSGVIMCFYWIISTVLSMIGLMTKRVWGAPLACIFMFFGAGVFSLAIPADPLMAGVFTFCLAYFGAVSAIYTRPLAMRDGLYRLSSIISQRDVLDNWLHKYRKPYSHILLTTIVVSLAVYGFQTISGHWISVMAQVIIVVTALISVRFLVLMYRHGDNPTLALLLLSMLVLAVGLRLVWSGVVSEALLFLYLSCLYVYFVIQTPTLKEIGKSFQSVPSLFILISFAGLVVLGTLFLYLPDAAAPGAHITLLDAFFTAISAACVTGLTVVDVNQDFSMFGQLVILIMMQAGGLGIMVLSTFAILLFGGKMGVRTEKTLSEFLSFKGVKSTYQLIIFIVLSTVAIEGIGAAILSYGHLQAGMDLAPAVRLGVFQAVSAFCNAGFSLTGDSLVHLQTSPMMLGCYAGLIILGGLGFVSMFEMIRRVMLGGIRAPLSVQTKIILSMSAVFVVGGGVLIALLEWNSALLHLDYGHKITNSFFQSITLRTAGFHSLDLESFRYPSMVIMLFFMFVGGAPGGTAGGVKVTTFATLIATLPTLIRHDNHVRIFSRTIPMDAVAKGSALIVLSLAVIGLLWFLLLITQPELPPMDLLFEVFSATGTVGLSLGVTESLGGVGRLIVACGMFVGRLGPLTLAIALAHDERSKVSYPRADIMIG